MKLQKILLWLSITFIACIPINKSPQSMEYLLSLAPSESELIYIKDSRTNICFASYWASTGYGGPAMATVDCEKVSNYVVPMPKE